MALNPKCESRVGKPDSWRYRYTRKFTSSLVMLILASPRGDEVLTKWEPPSLLVNVESGARLTAWPLFLQGGGSTMKRRQRARSCYMSPRCFCKEARAPYDDFMCGPVDQQASQHPVTEMARRLRGPAFHGGPGALRGI